MRDGAEEPTHDSDDVAEQVVAEDTNDPGKLLDEARSESDHFFIRDGQWFVEEPETGRVLPVLPELEVMAYHPSYQDWGRAVIDDFTSNSIRVRFFRDNTRFVYGIHPAMRMLRMGIDMSSGDAMPPSRMVYHTDEDDIPTPELPLPVVEAQLIAQILTELAQLPKDSRDRIVEALRASIAAL